MKKHALIPKPIFYSLLLIWIVQLACGLGGNTPAEENAGSDLAATEASLQQTQAAMDEQAQQPEPTDTPEPPPPTETPEPASPTETAEPELPQSQTYTSGDLIYFTDFLGDSDWEDGWVHFSIPESDYSVYRVNDYMHVEVPDTGVTVYLVYDDLYLERDAADVYVETGFDNLSSHNINQVSVLCRASVDGWYEFSLTSGGLWYIWEYDGNAANYNLLKEGGISSLDYDAFHTIGAVCLDDSLSFYLDGEMIRNASVTDNTFREGQVGVSVFAEDQWPNVIIEFDYFGVEVP